MSWATRPGLLGSVPVLRGAAAGGNRARRPAWRMVLAPVSSRAAAQPILLARTPRFAQPTAVKFASPHHWVALSTAPPANPDAIGDGEAETMPEARPGQEPPNKVRTLDANVARLRRDLFRKRLAVVSLFDATFNLIRELGSDSRETSLTLLLCCGEAMTDERPLVRTQRALEVWKYFEDARVRLGTEHYNALLESHLQNGHRFCPTEFLAWMESKGVSGDRVTYQHLMARCAAQGDVAGATAMLAHMRAEGMPANEYVFASLALCHGVAGDVEGARGSLEVMEQAGLTPTADTHQALVTGLIRSGQVGWDVISEELDKSEKVVFFSDRAYLKLMQELFKAGLTEEAKGLASKLPQKDGFLLDLRAALPQFIFLGQSEFAFELFIKDRAVPWSRTDSWSASLGGASAENSDHGLFVLRAMVKASYPPEKAVDVLERMLALKINRQCVARILEACVDLPDRAEYGAEVRRLALERFGADCLAPTDFDRFARAAFERVTSAEETLELMGRLDRVGVRLSGHAIGHQVLPNILANKPLFHEAVYMLCGFRNVTSRTMVVNNGLMVLMNYETKDDFGEAVTFMVQHPCPWKINFWNASLARAFLATGDLQGLMSVFFMGSIFLM